MFVTLWFALPQPWLRDGTVFRTCDVLYRAFLARLELDAYIAILPY